MRQYKAKKPCCLLGEDYFIGDLIPEEMVLPESRDSLIRIGLIEEVDVPDPDSETSDACEMLVPITILGKELNTVVNVKAEDISCIMIILQSAADKAAEMVGSLDDPAKMVLAAIDKRKAVKAAIETAVIDDADATAKA